LEPLLLDVAPPTWKKAAAVKKVAKAPAKGARKKK
jgi:hypothetical protein